MSGFQNHYSAQDRIRIVAIDPGNNLGFCVIDYLLNYKIFKVKHAMTLDIAKLVPIEENETDKRSKIVERLDKVKKFVKSYISDWCPDFIAHETAFVPYGGGGASIYSFASLVENIISIKFGVREAQKDARIIEVNPTTMKICIVGFKSSDKSLVLKALVKDESIDLSEIDVSKLNQHNADAIGLGVTCLRENFTFRVLDQQTIFNLKGKLNGGKKPKRVKRKSKGSTSGA